MTKLTTSVVKISAIVATADNRKVEAGWRIDILVLRLGLGLFREVEVKNE